MRHGITACISGWDDGVAVLRPCLESLADADIPIVYLDGSYRTYSRREPWYTDAGQLAESFAGIGAKVILADRRWHDEAEKRTALVSAASGAEWLLIIDADERLELGHDGVRGLMAECASIPATLRACAMVAITASDGPHYRLPRMIHPAGAEVRFHPPRDYNVTVGGTPLEEVRTIEIPLSVARIRHEREARPAARLHMSGRYNRSNWGTGPERVPGSGAIIESEE